jgi:hypothetical protein
MRDGERLVCIWENGSYVNSTGGAEEFLEGFAQLVKQFGKPSLVEIRQEHEGWIHAEAETSDCDSGDDASCEDSAR